MLRRLVRIVPLYWLFTTIKLVILMSTDRLVLHAKFDPVAVLCSYFFLPSYNVDGRIEPLLSVGWTLNFEMLFYAIFTVAIGTRRNLAVDVIGILVLLSLGSLFRPSAGPAILFYLNPIVLEFGFGILIAVLIEKRRPLPPLFALALLIAGLTALLAPFADSLPKVVGDGLPAALVVFAVACLEESYARSVPRVILFLGAASYSLYLSHPVIAPAVPAIMGKFGIAAPVISIAGSVTIAVIVGSLAYVFLEKPLTYSVKVLVTGGRKTHIRRPLPATGQDT